MDNLNPQSSGGSSNGHNVLLWYFKYKKVQIVIMQNSPFQSNIILLDSGLCLHQFNVASGKGGAHKYYNCG